MPGLASKLLSLIANTPNGAQGSQEERGEVGTSMGLGVGLGLEDWAEGALPSSSDFPGPLWLPWEVGGVPGGEEAHSAPRP